MKIDVHAPGGIGSDYPRLSLVEAESLFLEMLKNTRKRLPGWELV